MLNSLSFSPPSFLIPLILLLTALRLMSRNFFLVKSILAKICNVFGSAHIMIQYHSCDTFSSLLSSSLISFDKPHCVNSGTVIGSCIIISNWSADEVKYLSIIIPPEPNEVSSTYIIKRFATKISKLLMPTKDIQATT